MSGPNTERIGHPSTSEAAYTCHNPMYVDMLLIATTSLRYVAETSTSPRLLFTYCSEYMQQNPATSWMSFCEVVIVKVHLLMQCYSSTCHRRPPPVLSKSGPSWQVAPRDRERTLCAIMSNQKHTSDSIHSTAHAKQYKAQHSMTILNAVRHETNTAENV